ncbi:MAG: SsrA-binding protein SmpB [Planctomycetota bacterium]
MPQAKSDAPRSIAKNRRALYEYEVLDKLTVGIVLTGTEVKSLRGGRISLQESYIVIKKGDLWLIQAHIPEYTHGNMWNHAPTRERKLLAKRREVDRWSKLVKQRGTTIVPLEVFWQGSLVKLEIALAQGKKLHDKRQSEREKSDKREMARAVSRQR